MDKLNISKKLKWNFNLNGIRPYLILFFYCLVLVFLSHNVINRADSDIEFHMARIVGLAQSIRNFDFLPNLNYLFGNGIGYATPMFYGQWLLYPSSVLFIFTKSIKLSVALYAFIISFVGSSGSYYFFRKINNNSLFTLLVAMLNPLVYCNFGYGMIASTALIPFLLLALYLILFEKKKAGLLLGIVVALLVQTHIISTVILALNVVAFLIIFFDKITIHSIVEFIKSIIVALMLSIGFIFQFIEQSRSQVFFANWTTRPFMGMSGNSKSFYEVIESLFNTTTSATTIAVASPLIIFISFLAISILLEWKNISNTSKKLFLLALILLIFSSSVLPWNELKYTILGILQWPTRIITFIPSLIVLAFVIEEKSTKKAFYSFVIALSLFSSIVIFRNQTDSKAFSNRLEQKMKSLYYGSKELNGFSGMEYLTIDINYKEANNRNFLLDFPKKTKSYTLSNVKEGYNKLSFDFKVGHSKTRIVLPRIWYKGLVADYTDGATGSQPKLDQMTLTNKEIISRQLEHRPKVKQKVLENGRAVLEVNRSGHVEVTYKKTKLQKIGFILETISWIIVLIFIFLKKQIKNYRPSD